MLHSKITYGVGIIIAFFHGKLSTRHVQLLVTYAQQLKKFVKQVLPTCVKVLNATDGLEPRNYIENAENKLIQSIVDYVDQQEPNNGSNKTFHVCHITSSAFFNCSLTFKCLQGSIVRLDLSSTQFDN